MSIYLREYLYINTSAINDYLIALDQYDYEEATTIEKEENKKGGRAKFGFKSVGAEYGQDRNKANETHKKGKITAPAKFNRLFNILEAEQAFKYYEDFSAETWKQIRKNDILEIQGKMTFSNSSKYGDALSQMKKLAEIPLLSSMVNEQDAQMMDSFTQLLDMQHDKKIPIILSTLRNPKFKFVAYVNPNELLKGKDEFMDEEVTLFCKVKRVLSEDEEINLFDVMGNIENAFELNREQKRKLQRDKEKMPQELSQKLKYPAAEIIPIAIYR
ncbi:hypothetical protein CQZ91_21595 [Bacillus cereus]|uniref:DUF6414 family protein n=1 Tax=Bacillus cereus TaxID=1396 RepID=UPI000CFC7E7C|nr:hypothetical protein [Bacillus cereus]PRC96584.1 hypothetical protein CQZ92_21530 [Bacillus cereus]PRD02463.1 hypothetical protein CQZ91_21595 [Bacillus cereus]